MERKAPFIISEIINDEIITGKITTWLRGYMHVVTISPYPGWEEHLSITSWDSLRYYGDFRSEKGERYARTVLKRCHQKAEMVYSKIERLSKSYIDLKTERNAVQKIEDPEIREQINKKLEDWFFEIEVFPRQITDLTASLYDRKKTIDILEDHLFEKNKAMSLNKLKDKITPNNVLL